MKMNGNTVLITGGATGIGYSMAKYFCEHGNKVLICGRREDKLSQAVEELPGISAFKCDVADPDGRAALFTHVSESFPNTNILVNNAGIQRDIDLTKGTTDFDSGESEIRVNLEAPILLSALFTPLFAGKENAAIINVSSGLAFMPAYSVERPIYHTTKAGLHAFSLVQRIQLAPLGIKVIEIIPPAVESELNPEGRKKRSQISPPHRMATDDFVDKTFAQVAHGIDEIRLEQNR